MYFNLGEQNFKNFLPDLLCFTHRATALYMISAQFRFIADIYPGKYYGHVRRIFLLLLAVCYQLTHENFSLSSTELNFRLLLAKMPKDKINQFLL